MSAPQRQKVVYIFSGVIVAITLYVQFGVKVKKVLPEPVPTIAAVTIDSIGGIQPVVASSPTSAPTSITLTGATSFVLKDAWGSDPFVPRANRRQVREQHDFEQSTVEQRPEDWRLGGIIYLPSKPVAYVNDQPVHVGQMIDGAEVVDITKSSVVLKVRGERKTLTLGKG